MSDAPEKPAPVDELPKARVRPKSWRFPVVWIVPVVAAILAGYLVYGRLQEYGPTITIKFKDGGGVKAGRTEVHFRGVPIGEVRRVDLGEDQQYVVVHARLRQSASSVAKEGSKFWIVRPEAGLENVSGLSTKHDYHRTVYSSLAGRRQTHD